MEEGYTLLAINSNELTKDIMHIKRSFNQDHFDKFKIFEPTINAFVYAGEMNPKDFNDLRENEEYKYYLGSLIESHRMIHSFSDFTKKKVEDLIEGIQQEIEEKSN